MPSVRLIQRAFSGGELSPDMFGRADDSKYQSGLARCANFITTPHGPLHNRAGFAFVREVKTPSQKTRLLPFVYSTDQTMVIEMGAGYFRFHTLGQTLMNGSAPFEVANPYSEADLFEVHYVQSADVLTLVHPLHPPCELRRLGALDWQFVPVDFASPLPAPGIPTCTGAGHSAVKYHYQYVVTAITQDGKSESAASLPNSTGGNLYETGATVNITWPLVANAARYNVYKQQGGLYGYIGQTETNFLKDDNIEPDLAKTPPLFDALFAASGDYPGAVSYFEQRRAFAGTLNQPHNLWMTRAGTEANMSYSLPALAEDRIALRVAAREANTILHLVPLNQLILLTASAEWLVSTVDQDALTNTSISVRPQSYIGASPVQPVVVNNSVIYAAARGGHVRELGYNWQAGGFISGDLSLRAPHLFDDLRIRDMAFSKAPFPVVWCVSSDGRLLGLTYVPEQEAFGWHQHSTQNGAFESVCVVAEGERDVLYAVVQRTLNGQKRRCIERMAGRHFADEAFYVDCGASWTGSPSVVISGLDWLEGETVSILADGAVVAPQVVTNASIHLPAPARRVQVGLPIVAEAQTLPLAVPMDEGANGSGRMKNLNKLWLRVHRAGGFAAGADAAHLTAYPMRRNQPPGRAPGLQTDELELVLSPAFTASGQLLVRQSEPLPLTLVALAVEVALA